MEIPCRAFAVRLAKLTALVCRIDVRLAADVVTIEGKTSPSHAQNKLRELRGMREGEVRAPRTRNLPGTARLHVKACSFARPNSLYIHNSVH
jgi:hypothetical protein